jgi:hypothetical protein
MASKKSARANISSSTKKKNSRPTTQRSAAAPSAYSQLAQRTLDLWRDQLTTLARSPAALQEMNRTMQPAYALFTQGMDMWLMMTDPWTQGMAMGMPQATRNETKSQSGKQGRSTATSAKRPAASARSKASAADPIPGYAAMADLARRVANMERERSGKSSASGSRAAGSKTGSIIGFEEAAGQRLQRRRKA